MPRIYSRICPLCNRTNLLNVSRHLATVHDKHGEERKHWLKAAIITPILQTYAKPDTLYLRSRKKMKIKHPMKAVSRGKMKDEHTRKQPGIVEPLPYPEFKFRHKFSLLVVGPTQSGKTVLAQQILEKDHIQYDNPSLPRRIYWFYGQKQPIYREMKRKLGRDIVFHEGLPRFQDDLSDLDSGVNNICVLDDLMDIAVDSPIISRLFTQGRHKNASVVLMLQNAFPKGKYNTSISRNAQYIALFRSPADRRQIGMIADRIFDKNKPLFMNLYNKVTSVPYSYVLIDNKPDTPGDKQVIVDVFGNCRYFPGINDKRSEEAKPYMADPNDFGNEKEVDQTSVNKRDVLKMNDPNGPMVLNLKAEDFQMVIEHFRFCERSYNPNPGWTIWRLIQLKDYEPYGLVGVYPCVLRNAQNDVAYWCLKRHYVYTDMRYTQLKPLLDYKE